MHHRRKRRTGFAPVSPGSREPTIYGPLKKPTDKRRTGNTCSTTELLRRVVPKAGLEPATTRLGGDNPILRPVENAEGWTRDDFNVSGRESNPHLLVFTRCSDAVELPSAITEAQRPIPKRNDGQGARWESISRPMVRGLNALAVSRFTDNPNSTARRKWRARWESNPRLPDESGRSLAVELRDCPRSSAYVAPTSRIRF